MKHGASTTESPPSAGSGASGLRSSSGSAVAEGCVAVKALCEEVSCGFEFVADKAQAEEPGAHGVLGVLVLLGLRACRPHCFRHLTEGQAKLNVALQLTCVEAVLLAVGRGVELEKAEKPFLK